jgi:hypothetical protein
MNNNWDNLPNAKYIDLVLESLKANPNEWGAARGAARTATLDAAYAARTAAWNAAWDAAWGAARNAARNAAWDAALNAARNAALNAARNAILALIAYDDCAHMLDSDPDDLRILSKLGSHAATLMIPAAIAFKLIREKS